MQQSMTTLIEPVLLLERQTLSRRRLLGTALLATAVVAAGCAAKTSDTTVPASATVPPVPTSAAPASTATVATSVPAPATSAAGVPATVPMSPAQSLGPALALTSSSAEPEDLTPALTEGPYFKVSSPERTSLVDATTPGTRLTLTGRVLTADGQPVGKALLDFWQADASGEYDNAGYTLRGHQFASADGRYQLVTVIPGLYPGRTRHLHVKVQAPNGPVLTTQLFFPDEPQNSLDSIFNPKLVLSVKDAPDGGKTATFDFVISPN
jgi:protocatechuate 3,4-dioxygenase beta subunit